MQRRLRRQVVDEAEVERVRALTLQRLAGVSSPGPSQAAETASGPATDPDRSDHHHDIPTTPAATATGDPEAIEGTDMTDTTDQAPATGARTPVFRIAGLDEPPTKVAEVDLEPTPLVMFLGAPSPMWPSDPQPTIRDESDDADDAVEMAVSPDDPRIAALAQAVGEPPSSGVVDESVQAAETVEVEVVAAEAPSRPAAKATGPAAKGSAKSQAASPASATVAVAYCPYCATALQPAPTSDDRCTQCKQQIVVRRIDDRVVYLAEAALPVFEAERRRVADEARWSEERAQWLDLALASGATANSVKKAAAEVPSEAKVDAARDLYLASVDRSFESASRDGEWAVAARIRFDQARVLYDFAGAPIPDIAR